jgi:hypothetical protein
MDGQTGTDPLIPVHQRGPVMQLERRLKAEHGLAVGNALGCGAVERSFALSQLGRLALLRPRELLEPLLRKRGQRRLADKDRRERTPGATPEEAIAVEVGSQNIDMSKQ